MKFMKLSEVVEVIKSLGIVFGDIGTSPLYTLNALLLFATGPADIIGLVSLIVWTLIILVSIEYAWLAMSLGSKGEGGTIVLLEILTPHLKSARRAAIYTFIAYVGISLFTGDGVITPAVSILSAVEGLLIIESLKWLPTTALVFLACIIAVVLFLLQKRGTEKVSVAFGPLMVIWFATLALTGLVSIMHYPAILAALNPVYGLKFMLAHGFMSFFVLSGVILCATGGEALYADMGHLGRTPILRAWYFVFVALVLSYLGQGAFLVTHPGVKQVLHEMVFSQAAFLYIPFVLLCIIASVIASQALISGVFSVVYQGIMTGVFPRLKVDYTSRKMRSQVYIGFVNWLLLAAVLFMIVRFEKSLNLTYAYGFAVTGTMTITGILMSAIFYYRRSWGKMAVAVFVTLVDLVFLGSAMFKLPLGGYYSLMIAMIPLSIILIYTNGQRKKRYAMRSTSLSEFVHYCLDYTQTSQKIRGTALFFVRDIQHIHSYVVQTMFKNNIVYEDTILVRVITRDKPFGVTGLFKDELAPGVRVFEIHQGYMEVLNVDQVLRSAGIDAQVIFYGMHEIITKNPIWKIYATIDRLAPSFAQFYQLPQHKLHGVVTLVHL
jgi:KUP system potassium uptake protein